MKFKELKRGEVFKTREPYVVKEEYYMVIRCIFEGSNAVRLRDGRTTQFDNLADVTKVDVNVLELIEEAIGGES